MHTVSESVTNASDLGEFAYCHRAWWLRRVRGLPSANLAALAHGHALHETHGARARRLGRVEGLARAGLVAGLLLVALGLALVLVAAGGGA